MCTFHSLSFNFPQKYTDMLNYKRNICFDEPRAQKRVEPLLYVRMLYDTVSLLSSPFDFLILFCYNCLNTCVHFRLECMHNNLFGHAQVCTTPFENHPQVGQNNVFPPPL